ncbi:unnamed protein product, partial [Closterium sp. NIES-54]
MYALSVIAQGDFYRCVPPDPGIAAAALGASESGTLPGTAPAEALHTFTLNSGASRCFFRDSTTLTPLSAPVPVRLADPSGGPVVASASTVLPGPAVSASPPALACSALPSLRRGAAARRSSLLLVSRDDCSPADSPHGHVGPARVSGQGHERYILLIVDNYTRYPTVFPLRSKGEVPDILIPSICAVCLQLHERLGQDLPILRLHSDRGGEFSSNLLRDFCHGEGMTQSFTLLASPQENGIAERRIGLVMEVARTSMIHTVPPHFLWPFAVGDASVFRVWGSCAFVRDTSTDKLSARAIPCVFLGFVPNAPGWQFYHPTLCYVFPSQDVTFDESVPFYRLFPYRSAPLPPLPLFLAPGPPPVDPLPPQGPAPSGVSQVDSLPGPTPVEVAVGSGGARGAASRGAASGGAASEGAGSGGPTGASPRTSPQQLREWLVWRARLWNGATGAGGARETGAGGAKFTAGAGGTGGTAAAGPGGAHTTGTRAARTSGVRGAGAVDPTEPGAAQAGGPGVGGAGAGGVGACGTSAGGAGAGGAGVGGTGAGGAGVGVTAAGGAGAGGAGAVDPRGTSELPLLLASPLPAPSPYTEQSGGLTECREPASRPVSPVRPARRGPCSRPPPVPGTHTMALRPSSVPLCVPLPAPLESLPEVPNPEFDRARATCPTVSRLLATAITDPSFDSTAVSALVAELLDFAAACHLDYATALVAESASANPPSVRAAVPRFASMLLAPEGDPDAPDIPTPRSYAEAITGPYSSQWQAAMDAKMASWNSTSTYVDEVPPPGANIVDGMWIFRVKRPPGSPPAIKARYVARGFSQRQGVDYFLSLKMTTLRVLLHVAAQRDYDLHSLDFSTAFLQGCLHRISVFLLDVTFDESVPYYRLFPYRTASLPPPPLFLAPGPPPVDPLPPQGPAPSGVSQVDAVEPVEVAIDSGAATGAEPAGAGSGGAGSGGAETEGAERGGAESGGAATWGAEPGGAATGGTEPEGAEPGVTEPGGAEPGGAGSARVASHGASSRRE